MSFEIATLCRLNQDMTFKLTLKALDTFGNISQTSILTWCIPTYASNNNSVEIWTPLVIEVAREG